MSIVYYIYKGILGTATLLLIFAYCMNKNKLFVCFMQSRCLVSFIFVCVGVNVSFVIILSILLEQRNEEKFYRGYLLKLLIYNYILLINIIYEYIVSLVSLLSTEGVSRVIYTISDYVHINIVSNVMVY